MEILLSESKKKKKLNGNAKERIPVWKMRAPKQIEAQLQSMRSMRQCVVSKDQFKETWNSCNILDPIF